MRYGENGRRHGEMINADTYTSAGDSASSGARGPRLGARGMAGRLGGRGRAG